MNGPTASDAMPGARLRNDAPRPGSVRGTRADGAMNGAASEHFEEGVEASHEAADRFAAAAAASVASVSAAPLPDDPVAAALEQLRRNRASMVRSLAIARPPRRRSGYAGQASERWSLARTIGSGALTATARQHPFVSVGAALVAGVMVARLFGRRSIVRPMLLVPLVSRIVAPMVMRMATDAALRMVRNATDRGGADRVRNATDHGGADRVGVARSAPPRYSSASSGVPHPP